jgi:hypothetical protein
VRSQHDERKQKIKCKKLPYLIIGFLFFSFIIEFGMTKNYLIFNNSYTIIGLNIMKQHRCTSTRQGLFQWYQEHGMGLHG